MCLTMQLPSQLHSDEYLDVWFQSIVARKFTVQHDLTTALLNVERPSPLFEDLPFERSDTTGQFAISKQDLIPKRLAILQSMSQSSLPGPFAHHAPSHSRIPQHGPLLDSGSAPRPQSTSHQGSRTEPSALDARSHAGQPIRTFVSSHVPDSTTDAGLQAIAEETARGEYATFCRAVKESLQSCGTAVNDVTLPELRTLALAIL